MPLSVRTLRRLALGGGVALVAVVAAPAGAQTPAPTPPPAGHGAMEHGAMQHGAMDHGAMDHAASAWPAMDAFHQLMMRSWHPAAAAASDLAPARAHAIAMADRAEAWAHAAVPPACGGDETRRDVAALATDARAFASLATANTPDADLKRALAALHERFEKVEGRCSTPATPATPPPSR